MEERSICLRFCPSSLFENALRVVVRDVCHGRRRGGLDCLVNSDRNADLFPRGVKRGKGSAWRTKWIHRGFRGTRKAIPLPREETRSTVIRLEFCPPRAKRGGKWERGRRAFPLSSRVNSRHRSLFLFEYIYMYNCRSVVTNFLFSFSLSLSLFSLHTWNRWRQDYRRTTPMLENVFRLFPRVSAKETAQLSRAIVSSGTDRGNRASVQRISCVAATPR